MDGEANITMNCGDLKVFCVLESKALAVVCVSCGFWLRWIWKSEVEEFNLWRRRDPYFVDAIQIHLNNHHLLPHIVMLSPTTLQPFKTLLRKHLPSFHSSPCLLITSSPPIDTVQTNSKIDDFVRSTAQLLLSQNIRSIPITIDAAYPTKQKIQESLMVRW